MDIERWMKPPTEGVAFSGVIFTMKSLEDDLTEVWLKGSSLSAIVTMALPVRQVFTLYEFMVHSVDPIFLCPVSGSKFVPAQECTEASFQQIIEVCAGLGGISIGAEACDFMAAAFFDKNELVCDSLRRMNRAKVHQGDLTKDSDVKLLHCSLGKAAHTMTAGFACQPWSYQGDQGGFSDSRSDSFWGTLRACYLCQCRLLILECTPAAGKNHRLRTALQDFGLTLGLQFHDVFLQLSDQWPSQRSRWWAVLYPSEWPSIPLAAWTRSSDLVTVESIIPRWPSWTDEDIDQLRLSELEQQLYLQQYWEPARILDVKKPTQVFLHSYGNATGPCPCSCRNFGFKPERLQASGLRGVVLREGDGFRFMHPKEVAHCLAMPISLNYGEDHRATLCLLGQVASPLQSFWIFAQVNNILNEVFDTMDWINLDLALASYKDNLMFQAHHHWPNWYTNMQAVFEVMHEDGQPIRIIKDRHMRAIDLLQAERINLEWCQTLALFDGGFRVPEQALLQQSGLKGPYKLVQLPCSHHFEVPVGLIMASFEIRNGSVFVLVPAGSFLFEAMNKLELSHDLQLFDCFGRHWKADTRLWNSVLLHDHRPMGAGDCVDQGISLGLVRSLLQQFDNTALCFHWDVTGDQLPDLNFMLDQLPHGPLMICLLSSQHWQLIQCSLDFSGYLHFEQIDGLDLDHRVSLDGFYGLLTKEAQAFGFMVQHSQPFQQACDHTCGSLMLEFVLGGHGLMDLCPWSSESARHQWILENHSVNLQGDHTGFGPQNSQEHAALLKLTQLLVEKGVPFARAEERAIAGIKKIGLSEILAALDNQNPWQYLKAIASRPHVSYQWIKADELQQKVRAKASAKFTLQPSEKHKQKHQARKPEPPLIVDPNQLLLLPKTFFAGGHEIKQIPFAAIQPNCKGLAFATVPEVLPFLQTGNLISGDAVGVLTTTPVPREQVGTIQVLDLRFPAMLQATQEPLLIQGSLITLGKVAISRGDSSVQCELDSVPTQTLRLMVFKDQWPNDWNKFKEQPVRQLLAQFPLLNLCREQGCGVACGKFHAPLDESLDQLFLDLWSRSWHRSDLRFVKPDQAVIWSALVRVPLSATLTLQALSGQHGLYLEPRSDSGKESDPKFGVVWLGAISLEEAHHKCKTTSNALAICRVGPKYGLRASSDNMEEVHQLLKPDQEFMGSQIQSIYKLYPLPWGLQRHALQQCLKKFGWKARVLQTVGGGSAGMGWEVGAAGPPPSTVIQHEEGDIVITFVRAATRDPKPPSVLASAATKKYLRQGQGSIACSSGDDPWSNYQDPWAQGRQGVASSTAPSGTTAAAADRIQQIEQQLKSNLRSTIQEEIQKAPTAMETQDEGYRQMTEERFTWLESSMVELQGQSQKYETYFAQMHQQDQLLSKQLEETNQKLDAVTKKTHSQISGLNNNFDSIQKQMSTGFANIEALLAKQRKTS